MQFRFIGAISLLFALLLSGCATPMAFTNDTDTVSKTSKPIFLMTATLRNNYRTSIQPQLVTVNVEKAAANDSSDRINFKMDDKGKNETDSAAQGNSYLLRMELDRGEYVIRGLTSLGKSFPIIGSFFAPLHAKLKSSDSGVFYLGHVEASVRERKENEFKAGGSFPLIDQAVIGASGGTFDIEISDQWNKDEAVLKAKFPALVAVSVQKAILPPFDKAQAQEWWEKH